MQSLGLPIIDVGPLFRKDIGRHETAKQIGKACREFGFFYIVNHGIDLELQVQLETLSKIFFELPLKEKEAIAMAKGGRAWRGFFPLGGELTSGTPDRKEGIYFGEELAPTHPLVQQGLALHGPNLFPVHPSALRSVVLRYLTAMTELGKILMSGIALSLELDLDYFDKYTRDPFILFRIFHYPPNQGEQWGVGEHSDYGVLTILKQDECGGLEVKSKQGWIAAPPIPNSFVCNLGDMLDRMTGGLYRSTPHRVLNQSGRSRYSFPFFFDPNFNAKVEALPLKKELKPLVDTDDKDLRWDKTSVHTFEGTYGDYLLRKVGKVFPDLKAQLLV